MFGKKPEPIATEVPKPKSSYLDTQPPRQSTSDARLNVLEQRVEALEGFKALLEHQKEPCECALCGRHYHKKDAIQTKA